MNESVFSLDGRSPSRAGQPRREVMVEPEVVTALLRLRALGWGSKRIARELGISRCTVKRYVEAGGWQPFKRPRRGKRLDELDVHQTRARRRRVRPPIIALRRRPNLTAHLAGEAGTDGRPVHRAPTPAHHDPEPPPLPALLRPLADYEVLVGGAF